VELLVGDSAETRIDMKLYRVSSILSGNKFNSDIFYFDNGNTVDVQYIGMNVDLKFTHHYPFFAFVEIRTKLEELGILVMCNASRIDVYPSGASAIGLMAYEMEMGLQATKLVDIFERCENQSLVTTVELQQKYRERWLKSLLNK